ncbi:MAG: DNA polymerase III subunit delta' [Beijerinckiaceae bacterium]|nr:DNA polymerase III subunit delta' [Beijerinckiaceae bacterium]
MAPRILEAAPESDRFGETRHPRETHDFFGHGDAERDLLLSYKTARLPHAIIISGPPGIGKATLAWRLARFLLAHPGPGAAAGQDSLHVPPGHIVACQVAALAHPDLVLLRRGWNPETKRHATQIQVEDVRRAIDMFRQTAWQGGYRICVIDCADDLNASSANALLKLIEEPPRRSLFLIIAHRPGRLLPTLRSRCQKLRLNPLRPEDIGRVLTALGPPWSSAGGPRCEAAAARAQGSVGDCCGLGYRCPGLSFLERGGHVDCSCSRVGVPGRMMSQ